MADTKISWTDKVWNPVRGCSIVSKGCTNCYAMKQAHRFSGEGRPYDGLTKMTAGGPVWTGDVRYVPEKLTEPLHIKKPSLIFVNSMSDLFHEKVPPEFIDQAFAVMALCRQHTFQILTKRHEQMQQYLITRSKSINYWEVAARKLGYTLQFKSPLTDRILGLCPFPLPNVWLGVSVENKAVLDRMDILRETPAAVRFVSAEPLLESLGDLDLRDIHQVIVGGESGNKARPFVIGWAREIKRQCEAQGIAFYMKQFGARVTNREGVSHPFLDRAGADISEFPEDLRVREFPK